METILQTAAPDALNKAQTASRAGGWRRCAYPGIVVGLAAMLAISFYWHVFLGSRAHSGQRRNAGTVKEVSAAAAHKGDIGVWLNSLGTVESSNSVMFAIPSDYIQEVVRKFHAHEPLTVEAYDRTGEKKFGHGFLAGVDNRIDTVTGTLQCRAGLIPEGGNLMIPGLFLNIRMSLEVRHGVALVPAVAIQREAETTFVYVIRPDNTVTRRPVRIGAEEGKWVEIQSGLSPGEVVASSGFNGLQEGRKVGYELAPKVE